ncbi:MAG TPA: glycosyltransferase family 4 protein [Planctomycetota bacterium]|nr:glycosyltransferase family 4 protein [Planctomycetota bacterium]
MSSPSSLPDFAYVTPIVFGGFEGARYRGGRTQRLLARGFEHVTDASVLDQAQLSAAVARAGAHVWLVRAGTMPHNLAHWFLPRANGRPLCAFGIPHPIFTPDTPRANELLQDGLQNEWARLESEYALWNALQTETGGNFSELLNFHEYCPRIASVLIDSRLTCDLAAKLKRGCELEFALRELLCEAKPRCVRLPHLDVIDDPALRVAQVVTSRQRGGAERIALDLTRELPRWRVRTMYFALGAPTRAAFDAPEELVTFPPGKNRAEHLRNFAATAVAMGCDAVHAHLLSADDMALVGEQDMPLIATVHNARPGWPPGFVGTAAVQPSSEFRETVRVQNKPADSASTLPGVTLLAACAQAVERDLRDAKFKLPVRTVWNGIDAGAFAEAPELAAQAQRLRERLEFSATDFVLLALANPRPQKRLERLPAVLSALRDLFSRREIDRDVKLVIAGEPSRGSETAARCAGELRAKIEKYDVAEHVRLIGTSDHVGALLHACDALVSLSAWEGLSLAHLEALAAGRAVVATDAGGTAEIARDFAELTLVPLEAPAELVAEKLALIAERAEVERRLPAGSAAVERARWKPAVQSFALHAMASRYASLYPRAIEAAALQRRRPAGESVVSMGGPPQMGGSRSDKKPLPELTHSTRLHRSGEASCAYGAHPAGVGHPAPGVWLIANNFSTGGAQSSARRLLLGMHARGIRVRAATLQEREDDPTPGLRALRESGVPVFIPKMRSADPIDAAQQILERIDGDRPRAILFWNVIAEHKILLADAIIDIPIYDVSPGEMFFDALDAYFAKPRPGLPYRCAAEYGARLAGVIVKYRGEEKRAAELLHTPTHVISNGLPLGEWNARAREADGRVVIGTSARISPQKKLEELLSALRIAAPNLPPHALRIAGSAEAGAADYADRLRKYGADLCVEWVGQFQSSSEFLAGLDIFAMISEPAGCPNASLEAMAAALPIVATNYGGVSEQIEEGVTGRLVPRGDVRAFAAALVELARDEKKRREFGAAARVRAAGRFSIERMVDDYVNLCGLRCGG